MGSTDRAAVRLTREQVLRYRARVSHLDAKLPPGSYAEAAWGGLQDTVPRAGVVALHARVAETQPDAWEDPSVVQIWFRGADYVVPRADVGVFTLGSYPRDPARARELERWADAVHQATDGRTMRVRDADARLSGVIRRTIELRQTAITGRVHIRWDASDIWLIPVERPDIDPEDARRELARRLVHWYGPVPRERLARWTGVQPGDARETWKAIDDEVVTVDVDGLDEEPRFALQADLDELRGTDPVHGVRLIPLDDPLAKYDRELVMPDPALRRRAMPRPSETPGYAPNPLLVDGEVVGAWQRQQRRVTIHPFGRLTSALREAVEQEALAMPIAGSAPPSVTWDGA